MFMLALAAQITVGSLSEREVPGGITFDGGAGPGRGKVIVFLAGDEEYRSEEGLPQLARILALRHGFKCTVLFSTNERGEIDPDTTTNQPGLEALDSAHLCVMQLRFREWPDSQMKHFVDYFLSGKPIIALRTSTHAFSYKADSVSVYQRFGWQSKDWPGGFGKQVLGESWISHWGVHGSQATRGVTPLAATDSPILRGVKEIFGTTDVYEASPPDDAEVLVYGEVVAGMKPTDGPAKGRKQTATGAEQELNEPMMPVVWTRRFKNESGKVNKVLTCTMGAATDLLCEDLRRLLVNGSYWCVGLEKKTPTLANVDLVGVYAPSKFGFGGYQKGLKPRDLVKKG